MDLTFIRHDTPRAVLTETLQVLATEPQTAQAGRLTVDTPTYGPVTVERSGAGALVISWRKGTLYLADTTHPALAALAAAMQAQLNPA